jgi:methylated-DNA-[protein]-cysteine S-methyltransferase
MKSTHYFYDTDWTLGKIRLVGQLHDGREALTRFEFIGQKHASAEQNAWSKLERPNALFAEVLKQIREYGLGRRTSFDLPLAPNGTPFQQQVWREIASIDYAQSLSYGQIAQRVGSPNASRAVGAATGRNPIGIIIPCHRVLGSTGKLTGYAGGLARKIAMLELERGQIARLPEGDYFA